MTPDGSCKLRLFLSLRLHNLLRGTVKRSKAVPEDSFACSFHLLHSKIIVGKTCLHLNLYSVLAASPRQTMLNWIYSLGSFHFVMDASSPTFLIWPVRTGHILHCQVPHHKSFSIPPNIPFSLMLFRQNTLPKLQIIFYNQVGINPQFPRPIVLHNHTPQC